MGTVGLLAEETLVGELKQCRIDALPSNENLLITGTRLTCDALRPLARAGAGALGGAG
jgi:hypothetical protein